MLFSVFSVYDSAVQTYSPPLCFRALGQATRMLAQEARNPESKISQSPQDYSLFHLGHFDDEKGLMIPFDAPRMVLTALEASKPAL